MRSVCPEPLSEFAGYALEILLGSVARQKNRNNLNRGVDIVEGGLVGS